MTKEKFLQQAGTGAISSRRNFVAGMVWTALLGSSVVVSGEPSSGPVLWLVESPGSRVYIFGFADAKDRRWLSPAIEQAFQASSEVWFETPQPGTSPAHRDYSQPPRLGSQVADGHGHEQPRSLFDVLGPSLTTRTLAAARELGVQRQDLQALSPWRAYFVINNAFRKKYGILSPGEVPDEVIATMAAKAGKTIRSEYESGADLMAFFANLSDAAQREHLEDLLDYIADEKAGRNQEDYGWLAGHPDSRFIDRMRRKRPALYDAMHVQRNRAWATRISSLLSANGTYFVCIGLNHTLGPDSIPICLSRLGKRPRQV